MKTIRILIFLAACLGTLVAGASSKVDSLKRVLETHKAIDKAEVLWSIAYELFDVDNPQALFYAERAYHEVWHRGDSLQIVKVGTTYGQLLRRMGKLDRSIEVSAKLLRVAKRHDFSKYRKMLLNSLGLSFMFREDHDLALEYLYESLHLKQSDADTVGVIVALQNIGLMHYRLNDFDLAYELAHKAKNMLNQDHDSLYHQHSYLLLGQTYAELGEYDSSLSYLRKSFEYSAGKDALATIPHIYQAMAHAFLHMGRNDSAKFYAFQTIFYGSKQMDNWTVAYGNLMLSKIAMEEKDNAESKYYLNVADSVSRLADYVNIRLEVLRHEARLLSLQGQYEKALKAYEKYIEKKESVYNDKRYPRIRRVQLAFHQRENSAKIATQSSILLIQQRAIEQQQLYLLISVGFLSIILVLAIELYKSNRKTKSINKILDERIVERTNELLSQRNELKHNVDEQYFLRVRSASEITSLVGSLKGLVYLLKHDRESEKCYEEAIKVSERINDVARRIDCPDGALRK